MTTANGAETLLGLLIDGPSDRFATGQPGIDVVALAAPDAAPSAAAGAAGALTGSFLYRYSFGQEDGRLTDPGPASVAVVVSAKKVSLTDVAVSAEATCDRRVIERSADAGATWAICGYVYDNTATTFTDDIATLDFAKKLPAENQTGTNGGFLFLDPDSFDIGASPSQLRSQGLSGSTAQRAGVAGPFKFDGTAKGDLRPSHLAPLLMAGGGDITVTKHTGEPTVETVIEGDSRVKARTLTGLSYLGLPDVGPELVLGIGTEEIAVSFSGGKIVDQSLKLQGASFSQSGWAVKEAGTGTYLGSFVARGLRFDAKAETDDVYFKVTTAPAAGTLAIKVKVGALSTYTGAAQTIHYNTTSGRFTKGGTQFDDGVELLDENGVRLGQDDKNGRLPYVLVGSDDIRGLAVDDEYRLPRRVAIPGTGTAPYSGSAPVFADGPTLTDAHVTILANGTVVDAKNGAFKVTWPKPEKRGLGADARMMRDRGRGGFHAISVTIGKDLEDDTWRKAIRKGDIVTVVVSLEGPPIEIQPGTFSAHRHAWVSTMQAMEVVSVKSPVANQNDVPETIELQMVQPADRSVKPYRFALTTSQGWRVPA